MSKANSHKVDIDNLDLKRTYTFEEFELINELLKTRTLEIKGNQVNLFEFDNGRLLPMPQNPVDKEAVPGEIFRQLSNWNVQTRQNGIVTTSQGGFNFNFSNYGKPKIRAPDVAFIPKNTYRSLDYQQRMTFQGRPFTPSFVVEVSTEKEGSQKFNDLDEKFKKVYFSTGSSIKLGWLVNPEDKEIYIYGQRANGVVYSTSHGWNNVNGGSVLPGFTLEVEKIDDTISQKSSESSSPNEELEINCPRCEVTFTDNYTFMKHYEDIHARKWHKGE